MNDPKLSAEKFESLIDLASKANNEFEKAAVFAAAQALAAMFNEVEDELDPYVLEKVEQVRWHIGAAIGYDITNGKDTSQHVSWARGAAISLRDKLGQQ